MDHDTITLLLVLLSLCWTGGQCGTNVVQVPIGLESGAISASSITASSQRDVTEGPQRGRLHMAAVEKQGGGWVARKANKKQWIQVDLLTPYRITGVATQGRLGEERWVTSFKIACSTDNNIFDTVKDAVDPEADKIFPANSDGNTVVFNALPAVIFCRYVRLIPVTWHTFIALRMELYQEGSVTGTDAEQVPIGLEGRAIPDSSFTASSQKNSIFNPWRGRLRIAAEHKRSGGWVAKKADINQWIQVHLLTPYRITGVATQGRSEESQWVTSFKIACSSDNVIFDTVEDPDNTNADKIFLANSDRNTVVFNPLPEAILCRYLRLIPVAWTGFIGLRMELYREGTVTGPIQDASPLGLESGAIPDSSLTASSGWDADEGPSRSRLNIARVGTLSGGWSAVTNDLRQWIQIDLLATYSIVGVATQGREDLSQWVTSFKIACSMNSVSFETVKDPTNTDNDNIFPGNTDRNTVVYNRFPVPMSCRYVRLLPYTWHEHISLRMEFFGELLASTDAPTTMDTTMNELQTTAGETTAYSETIQGDRGTTRTASTTLKTSSEGTVAMTAPTRATPPWLQASTDAPTTMDTTMNELQTTAGETTAYSETIQGDRGTTRTASTTLKTSSEGTVAMTAPTRATPPWLQASTNMDTTMNELQTTAGETTAYLETTRGGQVTTGTASTTLKTSSEGTVAVTAPTRTTPPWLQGLLRVLADMNETETVVFAISTTITVYFTFLMLALLLRCIARGNKGLHKKEVELDQKRPHRMYELVRIPS
ncbi:uncharacterized protein LOC587535 isoform X3 [Strongylocentrotus purpuratus]|uniref:F5/8 type C domain-containing protein n=1 Tax=Strongylocentrotus purpuratus TaxID=7668 RepID=A0A7M7T242_STRPU|nr:uncharacterized protein LOC587535 isoform X3 [Strongylocentrotus purpuratus]